MGGVGSWLWIGTKITFKHQMLILKIIINLQMLTLIFKNVFQTTSKSSKSILLISQLAFIASHIQPLSRQVQRLTYVPSDFLPSLSLFSLINWNISYVFVLKWNSSIELFFILILYNFIKSAFDSDFKIFYIF